MTTKSETPATSEKPARPGMKQGRTNEFTIFFHVKPGHGQQIREIFQQPGYEERRQEVEARIGTLRDNRWVLFDDDTRLLFATNFDGDWDTYIEDFAADEVIGSMFDTVLQHTDDGWPGIAAPDIKDWIVAHQATACSYLNSFADATANDIRKALRVQEAFQRLLDEAS